MGWNERSDPDMRTANFCDVYREGVYKVWPQLLVVMATRTASCRVMNVAMVTAQQAAILKKESRVTVFGLLL